MRSMPTIHFVWEFGIPLLAGTGGSENYTIGHIRELNRRGVRAEVVTVGVVGPDGRADFHDVPFRALGRVSEVSLLDGIVVFVTEFPAVTTRRPSFQMLHVPPPAQGQDRARVAVRTRGRTLIATSHFAARIWSTFLGVPETEVHVVYPFAEACFSSTERLPTINRNARVLFAGRLSPEKGVFTLLSMLHLPQTNPGVPLRVTATTSGSDKPHGAVIKTLLEIHPSIQLLEACKTPQAMAALMTRHDVVVMPSNSQYWHETFGIVSIEAQHSGCRVVASNDGGLPETDCGAIIFVRPDDASALAGGIDLAWRLGPLSIQDRADAARRFTVGQSTTDLLALLGDHSSWTREASEPPESLRAPQNDAADAL
jgi:glycosyltransferase involved in cell wall biosynthesis